MSTKYKHSHEVPTAVLAQRLVELSDAVGKRGEERDRELTRRVPAELDRDADLVLYEAAQRLLKVEALCGAAAVALERTANDTLDGRNMAVRLREANTSSLARLKAQWQAEALERCAKGVAACKPGATPRGISIAIKMEAAELRRQAEGGEQ